MAAGKLPVVKRQAASFWAPLRAVGDSQVGPSVRWGVDTGHSVRQWDSAGGQVCGLRSRAALHWDQVSRSLESVTNHK